MFALKIVFLLAFIATFVGGIMLLKNFNKAFGPDPNVPSENESSLLLNKSQAILIWLFALKLFGLMAWIL